MAPNSNLNLLRTRPALDHEAGRLWPLVDPVDRHLQLHFLFGWPPGGAEPKHLRHEVLDVQTGEPILVAQGADNVGVFPES